MEGAEFRRASRDRPYRRVQKGDRIRVILGALANTQGTVIDFASNCRCVLSLDGMDAAIRIVLPFDAVESAELQSGRWW